MVALVFGLYFKCTCIARCLDLGVLLETGLDGHFQWSGRDLTAILGRRKI